MTIKEIYELYPKVAYPMITIREIANEEVTKYSDSEGENVSYLAYQIGINAEQSETRTAIENVRHISDLLDTYMKGDRYKAMRRVGSLSILPLGTDKNVVTGYLRYECHVDINTNTIYRRY